MKKIIEYVIRPVFFLIMMAQPFYAKSQNTTTINSRKDSAVARDGQHDFDFELGAWKTKLSLLTNPLTGAPQKWVVYEGTTIVKKVLDGKANLVELVADGASGHIEALSLRLYNPKSKQWSLNFANIRSGTLAIPSIGEFKNGRGEFYNQEEVNGRAVLVRFSIIPQTADSIRFEQSYSDDGGKTWEVNWIAVDTRLK